MSRNLQQRLLKIEKQLRNGEEIVSAAARKRAERHKACEETVRPKARLHATAVAAIVMFGRPKIDEPLARAWARTLRYNGIAILNEYGREFEHVEREREHPFDYQYEKELRDANPKLYSVIVGDRNEAERFTAIFRAAPVWLLEFTWMRMDAHLLGFRLPRMSDKQVWGKRASKNSLNGPCCPWAG